MEKNEGILEKIEKGKWDDVLSFLENGKNYLKVSQFTETGTDFEGREKWYRDYINFLESVKQKINK